MSALSIVLAAIAIVVGGAIGYFVRKSTYEQKVDQARNSAEGIISSAKKDAETAKKEAIIEAKEESHQYRASIEEELKERRSELQKQEDRLLQRETTLDHKDNAIEKRENVLSEREQENATRKEQIQRDQQHVTELIEQRQADLQIVAEMSKDDARTLILDDVKSHLTHEREVMIRDSEQEAAAVADKKAKELIVSAIQRSAADMVSETTVSVVTLPNDDMKGRIIGREGRNIRTLETLTGIDLIIDDTPEAVVLSGFDPIRREIAKMALEKLIQDGRIHPARIEEAVEKAQKDMDQQLREAGEQTVFDLGVHSIHPDLIKIIGRMKYRTSYGQNVLNHSIEVAKIAGIMAGELGEDVTLAKRAGLLHDIGKAVDHEVEGSHVELGVELTTKYKENSVVINTIASHHGDVEPESIIAVLVQTADAISGARPGARSESLENYIQRLKQLETIANKHAGVDHSYAIQAGREVRVMVEPKNVSDLEATALSHDIKNEIEDELEYPGHIKVTVIREVRAIDYAK
ncbi:ribonuclease Y [Paucilactobacillus nenjiangensis]|uniref:ribonuclease Y n=1 Tax=Paucilactobacillus nenjiangensis TaxID=1296540 RepID=UPI0010F640D1|nr:ribonuclease Y [Paucilactobacillus nenjiangensis]